MAADKQLKITMIGNQVLSSKLITMEQAEQLDRDLRSTKTLWFDLPKFFYYENNFLNTTVYIPNIAFTRVHPVDPNRELKPRGRERKEVHPTAQVKQEVQANG